MKYTLYLIISIFLVIDSQSSAQIINTYAGNGIYGFGGDSGPATSASLKSPTSLAADPSGNIYFTDQLNFRTRKVNNTGVITTIAGNGIDSFSGDGGPSTACYTSDCWGVATDLSGNIYLTDQLNYRIRKINTSGVITTIAGTGVPGYSGDNGPATAAKFSKPLGIAIDRNNDLFIGDQDYKTIKKINPSGIITNFAGKHNVLGYTGDGGPATDATFSTTFGLATDEGGNVYVCDAGNHCIRRIDSTGIISTFAGVGIAGFSGDGGYATASKLNYPTGVFADHSGNVYIADNFNQRIRRVNPLGKITTIAGTSTAGFSGDNGLCTLAQLNNPTEVITDNSQNIYFSDYSNNRIRKITMVLFFASHSVHIHFCQNTPLILLDSVLKASDQAIGLMDKWSIVPGITPVHGTAFVADSAPASGSNILPAGSYYAPNFGFVGSDTLKVIVTNGIATDTETVYITMDAFINNAGKITGDSMVCVGTSVLLTDTAAGGKWTVSNLNAVVIDGVVKGQMAGTDTIIYTVSNTCGHAIVTKSVTVNPLPFTGTISGIPEVCVGTTVVFNDTAVGGIWSVSNRNVTINPLLTSCNVNGYLPGKDSLYYTVTDSFCTASTSISLTIISLPVSDITGGSPALCLGSQDTVYGLPPGGIWDLANTNATLDSLADMAILTGMTSGPDTLTYKVTNYCGSAVADFPFETDTIPARPSLLRSEGILYATPGYAAYQWYMGGLPVAGAIADTYVVSKEGDYSVRVSNRYGCSEISDTLEFPGCGPMGILVFPNPAASVVYVTWCHEVTLRLICMDGRVALTLHHTNQIDLSGLANENYLLAIYNETGNKVAVKLISKLEQ